MNNFQEQPLLDKSKAESLAQVIKKDLQGYLKVNKKELIIAPLKPIEAFNLCANNLWWSYGNDPFLQNIHGYAPFDEFLKPKRLIR